MTAIDETPVLPQADVDAFLRAIVAAPGDPVPRLQFADWLNERGAYAEEAGQRWAAKHGKRPMLPGEQGGARYVAHGGWYVPGSTECLYCAILPYDFWPNGWDGPKSEYYDLIDPLECERWFLKQSALLTWKGNRLVARKKGAIHA